MNEDLTAVSLKVVDTDTHVTEPPDLWTSRLPSKWAMYAPRVELDPDISEPRWRIGEWWLTPVAWFSSAGWPEFYPGHPPTLEEADAGTWNPVERLKRMDEYGIYAAVLYPNLIAFNTYAFMKAKDLEFSLACVRAYNDFITEFASVDRKRLVPISMLPFWDLEAARTEMERCRTMGHPGVLFANKYEQIGLPPFYEPYWDPILSAAQEMEMSINFHIGFSSNNTPESSKRLPVTPAAMASLGYNSKNQVKSGALAIMGNADIIAKIVTSDLCERYPELNFVSVESGFGYVPYLLESLDWHCHNYGAQQAGTLLPSEYFRRQCYGTFWFEKMSLPLLEEYPDNFMFETDYPHQTSLSPGPASSALRPDKHIASAFSGVPAQIARKVLYENAAKLYGL